MTQLLADEISLSAVGCGLEMKARQPGNWVTGGRSHKLDQGYVKSLLRDGQGST